MSLRVHSNAHVLHAYVNGKYVGHQIVRDNKFDYRFEKKVNLVHGTNHLALLSVSVGLQVKKRNHINVWMISKKKIVKI